MSWTSAVDFDRALTNVQHDVIGDWYRDPWGWPEYGFEASRSFAATRQRLTGLGARRSAKIDVPKENFNTRPAIVMDPLDRLVYQGLVDLKSRRLIGDLPSFVYGWRLPRKEVRAGHYARNDKEWDRYRGNLQRLVSAYDLGLKTDIVSCFASISVERLSEQVGHQAGGGPATARLTDLVAGWAAIPGRSGLAQRSSASAVLANMYLQRLDDVLSDHVGAELDWARDLVGSPRATRWMDDIWVFGDDEAELRKVQLALQHVAREAGMELHAAKTKLLAEDALAQEALAIEHSAVDQALSAEEQNLTPLEELLDRIVAEPESADRTSIHFACSRLRRSRVATRVDALIDAAPRMPQGADHTARVARDFHRWEDRQDWYLEYVDSDWACIEWSVAQLGTMFPSRTKPSKAVIEHFESLLLKPRNIATSALITQRLAAWEPGGARAAFRAALDLFSAPLERRLIALAGHAAGEERKWLREVLSEYEENNVVSQLLEESGWAPIPAVPDFSAGSTT